MGFPPAYVFAMLCDWFVAGPIAKGVAFRFFVRPGSSPRTAATVATPPRSRALPSSRCSPTA